jgi:hypothetical protein
MGNFLRIESKVKKETGSRIIGPPFYERKLITKTDQ